MSGWPLSRDGERNRFLEPDPVPERIDCSCGRRVAADDVALCQRCDKVLCDSCGTENELEIRCCDACMTRHVSLLAEERNDARAEFRRAIAEANVWHARYGSMRNLASVCMVVIGGAVIGVAIWLMKGNL